MSQPPTTSPVPDLPLAGPANRTWALFLISVLGLFLELMLIRWIGTEIRIFAYLQNTVLVVCFLGLGVGCWTCRKPCSLRRMLIPLFVLILLLAIPYTRAILAEISQSLSVFSDLVIWYQGGSTNLLQGMSRILVGLALTFVLMMLLWDMFVPIGRMLGRLLDDHPRTIWAYSVNISGSLIGIWLFVAMSAWYQPPIAWVGVVAILSLFFLPKMKLARNIDIGLLIGIVVLSWVAGIDPDALEVIWSPYQKLALKKATSHPRIGEYVVEVNNIGYQAIIDLRDESVRADPARYAAAMRGLSQYDLPLLLHPQPRRFLAVGAGTGNDAAGGLRNGAQQVVAVDIDPAILDIGKRQHPERPYTSPGVQVVNDDARSYFATCTDRFDVIAFGLLDSHTTTAMTNARLDHYVYTRESLQAAKGLLTDGGIILLSFEAQKAFIADRMGRVIREVFQQEPLIFRVPQTSYGWGGVVFVAGDLVAARRQMEKNPALGAQIAKWQKENPVRLPGTTPVATDDWPYIYLEHARIPVLYYLLAGLLVLLLWRGLWKLQVRELLRGWQVSHWHFFFLGAAFMLLEVQNISKAAVVLGNTWSVNAVIISSILALILAANWIVARFPKLPTAPVYVGLIATCVALYFVDISRFGFLPYPAKAAIVGGLTSLPMLFSGIIFIRSFATVPRKDTALGANLLGSLVGGLLQSITFVIGVKALLLVVAALYGAAFLTRPRSASAQPELKLAPAS